MRYSTREGYYSIDSMPNQPSVAICSDFTIYPEYQGKSSAHKLKEHQMDQLKLLGYTSAICTVQKSNEAQQKVLRRAGWVSISYFLDQRSGGMGIIYVWN